MNIANDLINAFNDGYQQGKIDAMSDEFFELRQQLSASQRREKAARNELCLKCGLYHEAHNGACDGCRWKE